MSELAEKAVARILYNKLMECFDDLESLTQIQSTQDFKLICELDATIEKERKKQNIDYSLVVGAWNEFYSSVKQLNEKSAELINHISEIFSVSIKDDFFISGTLYNHEKLFVRKLTSTWIDIYRDYILELDRVLCNFKIKLLSYGNATIQDEFFDDCSIIIQENIKFQKLDLKNKSIYLDTNAVQVLAGDRKIKNIMTKSEVSFVYSSYLIEDAVNSNPIFLSSFLSDLQLITNGNMVGYMEEGLCFVKEGIQDTIDRVKKYLKLTKLYESTTINNVIQHFHLHPELRKGRELSNCISHDPIGYFKSEKKHDVTGFDTVASHFCNTNISDFIESGDIGEINDYKDAIEQLSNLFDYVNFETEHVKFSNMSKIASSYRDRQHLEHAYICDYFVSDDIRLKKRAQTIFEILGIKTKVIGINELKVNLKNQSL